MDTFLLPNIGKKNTPLQPEALLSAFGSVKTEDKSLGLSTNIKPMKPNVNNSSSLCNGNIYPQSNLSPAPAHLRTGHTAHQIQTHNRFEFALFPCRLIYVVTCSLGLGASLLGVVI